MSEASKGRRMVLQVLIANRSEREAVERDLRASGRLVLGRCELAPQEDLHFVTAAFELTGRDLAVLRALARYDSSKEIAVALGVTPKAVDDHIQRLTEELGVGSRHRLLAEALIRRWVEYGGGT